MTDNISEFIIEKITAYTVLNSLDCLNYGEIPIFNFFKTNRGLYKYYQDNKEKILKIFFKKLQNNFDLFYQLNSENTAIDKKKHFIFKQFQLNIKFNCLLKYFHDTSEITHKYLQNCNQQLANSDLGIMCNSTHDYSEMTVPNLVVQNIGNIYRDEILYFLMTNRNYHFLKNIDKLIDELLWLNDNIFSFINLDICVNKFSPMAEIYQIIIGKNSFFINKFIKGETIKKLVSQILSTDILCLYYELGIRIETIEKCICNLLLHDNIDDSYRFHIIKILLKSLIKANHSWIFGGAVLYDSKLYYSIVKICYKCLSNNKTNGNVPKKIKLAVDNIDIINEVSSFSDSNIIDILLSSNSLVDFHNSPNDCQFYSEIIAEYLALNLLFGNEHKIYNFIKNKENNISPILHVISYIKILSRNYEKFCELYLVELSAIYKSYSVEMQDFFARFFYSYYHFIANDIHNFNTVDCHKHLRIIIGKNYIN